MKIYNEIVFDADGKVLYEDSYEYSGDVMLLGGYYIPDMDGDGVVTMLDAHQWANKQRADGILTEAEIVFTMAEWFQGRATEPTGVEQAKLGEDLDPDVLQPSVVEEATKIKVEEGGWDAKQLAAQTQASDMQLKPLPSIPSISSVGSVSFSGTVNRNAVPGGFQPLPQTAGGRKKLYQLSQFHGGYNLKTSPRDISDMECTEAYNVTFSSIGRIKLLGDCKNENNAKEFAALDVSANLPGYGLFEFAAPLDPSNAVAGDHAILLTADGNQVDALVDKDSDGGDDTTTPFIDLDVGTDSGAIAQIYYAAGSGVYAADATFINPRRAAILVYREDAGSNTVEGWSSGLALLSSPSHDASDLTDMNAGTVRCNITGGDNSGDIIMNESNGSVVVKCAPTSDGSWDGDYFFYISWLFDGGTETGLTSFAEDSGNDEQTSSGITFDEEHLLFNLSILHANGTPLGADKRIEGARIYFKESGTSERWLLAEFNMTDGVKGALDSTFTPWNESSDVYNLTNDIIFNAPPSVYSYASLNGYYANEVYGDSTDIVGHDSSGPVAHDVRYKTCVVGSGGIVYIGNVKFKGKTMADTIMYSVPHRPGVFPRLNYIDSASSDGSGITALASYRDTILQFKENGMFVINVSNGAGSAYTQASFRDCGVFNPCQVFTTSFGVIFVNKHGCFIYDGSKVISLTGGKFDWPKQSGVVESKSNTSDGKVPCIGYDPRSQSIIILADIGDDSTNNDGWVYNMPTQSWSLASLMIGNGNGTRHTNFIITKEGYLSIKSSGDRTLLNYNHDKSSTGDTGDQDIIYQTKDLDFGLPTQTKKVFKVYVTYFSDDGTVPVMTYGINGDLTPTESFVGTFGNSATLQTTAFTVSNTALTGIYSLRLKIAGTADHSFEIQDISILYRARPIK